MARTTKRNSITSAELLSQVNPDNLSLLDEFMEYLKSTQRSETTIFVYKNDLEIVFCWNVQFNKNKFFVEWTKRDIIKLQNWLITENGNSPARVRRIKSTMSSLSNYIENILDDEFKDFRNIIHKVESPVAQPVREKTVLTDEQVDFILDKLTEKKQYEKACMFALAACSGRRKSELVRFKVSYFDPENIIYGSLYKTPETIKTKGRGNGKFLYCYTLANKFKPYLDAWMKERADKGIESEWLFPNRGDHTQHRDAAALNNWARTITTMLETDFYWHCLRHYFTTHLVRMGLPDGVIQDIIGWTSADMLRLYTDIEIDEQLGKYFDENGIKQVHQAGLSEL